MKIMGAMNRKIKPTGSKEIDQILMQAYKRIEDSQAVLGKIDRAVSKKNKMTGKKRFFSLFSR